MRAPSALIRAARRLLCRAALFLWMMRLSAIASMTDCSDLNAASAAALSPASIAFWIFLIAVRKVVRRRTFASRWWRDLRARLAACLVFAMRESGIEVAWSKPAIIHDLSILNKALVTPFGRHAR